MYKHFAAEQNAAMCVVSVSVNGELACGKGTFAAFMYKVAESYFIITLRGSFLTEKIFAGD